MPHSRFFIDCALKSGIEVALEGEEMHHLLHVMRKKEGEVVELVNGQNQLAQALITSQEKKKIRLKIQKTEEKPAPSQKIILCQAIPRINRLDTIIEKGTELGMHEIWMFPSQLSERKELSVSQLKRLEGLAIAAMKQCGRLDLPKIAIKPPLVQWERLDYSAYFGDMAPNAPKLHTIYNPDQAGMLFFIGPEAGFTSAEEDQLRLLGAQGVNLHANILRTDTASLVALTLMTQFIV